LRIVLQRVKRASVVISEEVTSSIAQGWVVLVGIGIGDDHQIAKHMAEKISTLRLFSDSSGKFNLSALEIKAECLIVSQFTLYADLSRGRRPSFTNSENPIKAEIIYNIFIDEMKKTGLTIKTGTFGADMQVSLINDGPVTISIDSSDYE
jgi:D-tyrosyl-tRNA(Tyr) deacylase